MRVPKKIKVLTETYRVELVDGLRESHNAEGLVEPYDSVIKLDSSLVEHPKMFWRVFWHEVGHAFCFQTGVIEFIGHQGGEMFAENFAAFMCQLEVKARR